MLTSKIPKEIFIDYIYQYCATAEDLSRLKCVNKYYNKTILTHQPMIKKCATCKNNRFSISGKCHVENCMVIPSFHPHYRYYDDYGNYFCSLCCCMSFKEKIE